MDTIVVIEDESSAGGKKQHHAKAAIKLGKEPTQMHRRPTARDSVPFGTLSDQKDRISDCHTIKPGKPQSVASILERQTEITIQNWLDLVEQDVELTCIPLGRNKRAGHLPKLFRDLILRLRSDSGLATPNFFSSSRPWKDAVQNKGNTAAMVVEESRILQVSIFTTL
jgi:hypothetical protein